MHDAVTSMLAKYSCATRAEYLRAWREILQEVALLGLWRTKFFEKAAFYGDTALRVLYGLDRFSEDLDFSLLQPDADFDLNKYSMGLEKELTAFGFDVTVTQKNKTVSSPIQSAFLKTNTLNQLLVITSDAAIAKGIPAGQILKIKLEVDTNPPAGFSTESRYLLQPIPFAVRSYTLADLFAGKMHALLCRKWKTRVKGRDWYDLVWYVTHHPRLHLAHLEQRMRQSGHWTHDEPITESAFSQLMNETIHRLNIHQAAQEVEPFVKDRRALELWSREFFVEISKRIELV